MSGALTYAWRQWSAHGGRILPERFDTARDAGAWRREQHGPDHHGLTLVALDSHGRVRFVTAEELCDAQFAWQRPDLGNDERAAAPVEPRPAA